MKVNLSIESIEIEVEQNSPDPIHGRIFTESTHQVTCLKCGYLFIDSGMTQKKFIKEIRSRGWSTRNGLWHCVDCK